MIVMIAYSMTGRFSIAYDNVHYSDKPEKWNMRLCSDLDRPGCDRRRGCVRIVHLASAYFTSTARTPKLMYLKLSVATSDDFLTRTRGRSGPYVRAPFSGSPCSAHKQWRL